MARSHNADLSRKLEGAEGELHDLNSAFAQMQAEIDRLHEASELQRRLLERGRRGERARELSQLQDELAAANAEGERLAELEREDQEELRSMARDLKKATKRCAALEKKLDEMRAPFRRAQAAERQRRHRAAPQPASDGSESAGSGDDAADARATDRWRMRRALDAAAGAASSVLGVPDRASALGQVVFGGRGGKMREHIFETPQASAFVQQIRSDQTAALGRVFFDTGRSVNAAAVTNTSERTVQRLREFQSYELVDGERVRRQVNGCDVPALPSKHACRQEVRRRVAQFGITVAPGSDGSVAVLDLELALLRSLLDGCAFGATHPLDLPELFFVLKFDAALVARNTQMLLACVAYPMCQIGASSEMAQKIVGVVVGGKEEKLEEALLPNQEALFALLRTNVLRIPACAAAKLQCARSKLAAAAVAEAGVLCADCASKAHCEAGTFACACEERRASMLVCADDAALRALFGLGSHRSTFGNVLLDNPIATAAQEEPVWRDLPTMYARAHVPHPFAQEGPVVCPDCGYRARTHAEALEARVALTKLLRENDTARRAHASAHHGQLYAPMAPIAPSLVLVPLLHLLENIFSYSHLHVVWDRLSLFGAQDAVGSKAQRDQRINELKYDAAALLAACGIAGVHLPPRRGDEIECPSFLGTEIRKLLCSEAFLAYLAFVVQATTSKPAARPAAGRTAVSVGPRTARLSASLLSHAQQAPPAAPAAGVGSESDEDEDATGPQATLVRVARVFDAISLLEEHVSSVNYNDADPRAREAHAAKAARLGKAYLKVRSRALAASNSDGVSVYDAVVAHVLARCIRLHGHLLVYGREDGQEKKNQQAKSISRRRLVRVKHFLTYFRQGKPITMKRTWAQTLAEQLAVAESASLSAMTCVKHYAESAHGQVLARKLADGEVVKRARVHFVESCKTTVAEVCARARTLLPCLSLTRIHTLRFGVRAQV